jgi:hypothetical protein
MAMSRPPHAPITRLHLKRGPGTPAQQEAWRAMWLWLLSDDAMPCQIHETLPMPKPQEEMPLRSTTAGYPQAEGYKRTTRGTRADGRTL